MNGSKVDRVHAGNTFGSHKYSLSISYGDVCKNVRCLELSMKWNHVKIEDEQPLKLPIVAVITLSLMPAALLLMGKSRCMVGIQTHYRAAAPAKEGITLTAAVAIAALRS